MWPLVLACVAVCGCVTVWLRVAVAVWFSLCVVCVVCVAVCVCACVYHYVLHCVALMRHHRYCCCCCCCCCPQVQSDSLVFSVMILVIMLALVIGTIAASGWRMTTTLGITMFGLYCVFVAVSLLIEYGIINPPALR